MMKVSEAVFREGYHYESMNKKLQEKLSENKHTPHDVLKSLVSEHLATLDANNSENSWTSNHWETKYRSLLQSGILKTIENRIGTVQEYILDPIEKEQNKYYNGLEYQPSEITDNLLNCRKYFDEPDFNSIVRNLKNSNTEWAQKALKEIQEVDPTVGDIIVKQLSFGSAHDFVTCLLNEYDQCLSFLSSKNKQAFEGANTSYKPKSPVKSLLPIKEYYQEYPDAVRMGLNMTDNLDPFVLKNFGETVRAFLNLKGIDILNPVVTTEVAREILWARSRHQAEKRETEDYQKYFCTNSEAQKKFFKDRGEAIKRFFSKKDVQSIIDMQIADTFNRKLGLWTEFVHKRCRETQVLERKKRFGRLREQVMNNSLTPKVSQETHQQRGYFSSVPMEIVNDPQEEHANLNKRYYLSQREQLLNRTRSITPAKVRSYFNGSSNKHDMYDITLADPENYEIETGNYFRDFKMPLPFREKVKVLNPYRERLFITGKEDEREVGFREGYIAKTLGFIQGKISKVSKEKLEELNRDLRDKLFDYLQGGINSYYHTDPHMAQNKEEVLDVRNSVLMNEMAKAKEVVQVEETNKELGTIRDLLDLNFERTQSFPQKSTNEVPSLSSPTEIDRFLEDQINMNEFLKERLGFIYSNSDNPVVRVLGKDSRQALQELFKAKVSEIYKSCGLQGEIPLNCTYSGLLMSDNEESTFAVVDYYLNKNLQFEFFEYLSAHLLFNYSYEMLSELERVFNSIKNIESSSEGRENLFRAFQSIFKIKLATAGDLDSCFIFLDKFATDLSELMTAYEEKLHFYDDLVKKTQRDYEDHYSTKLHKMKRKKNNLIHFLSKLSESASHLESKELTYDEAVREAQVNSFKVGNVEYNLDELWPLEFGKLSEMYKQAKTTFFGNKRYLVGGSYPLIFEMESLVKRAVEGKHSGIDEDLSQFNNTVKLCLFQKGQTAEEWLRLKVTLT
jgi:hypothetical protein